MSVQDGAIVGDPAWTEYRKKNGLDPLGMQNSSVNLYQTFLPGVSNVTLRMRYYGLYAWLCRTYAQRNGDTDPASWRRVVRRAEAMYALTAQQHGGEAGVAGIEWAQRILATESDPIEFAPSTDPARKDGTDNYLAQEWGAYGAAYRSQLAEIGILGEVPGHDLPAPTPRWATVSRTPSPRPSGAPRSFTTTSFRVAASPERNWISSASWRRPRSASRAPNVRPMKTCC